MHDIYSMFGFGGLPAISKETIYYMRSYAFTLIIGIFAATPAAKIIAEKVRSKKSSFGEKTINVLETIVVPALLVICTAYLVDGSFNPFLYFRF